MTRTSRTTGKPVPAAVSRKTKPKSKPKTAAKPKSVEADPNRQKDGRFGAGNRANPGGRPKAANDVRDLARQHTAEAIERLLWVMRGSDERASVSAANAILDRAWGKPSQALAVSGDGEGAPVQHAIRIGWMTEAEARDRGWA